MQNAVDYMDRCQTNVWQLSVYVTVRFQHFAIIPPRPKAGWRGTTRYGSLNAHHRRDLSRRDDLESWLYVIIELTKGALPWRLITGL